MLFGIYQGHAGAVDCRVGRREEKGGVSAGSVPGTATEELPVCRHCLHFLRGTNGGHISSARLDRTMGISDTAVHESFSCFNTLNGEKCNCSIRCLLSFFDGALGRSHLAGITLVNINGLNRTLLGCGFRMDGGIHVDTTFSIGRNVINGVLDNMPICPVASVIRRLHVRRVSMTVLAIPRRITRSTAGHLARTNIHNVVGFAPVHLSIPRGIHIRGISLAGRLRALVCFLSGSVN